MALVRQVSGLIDTVRRLGVVADIIRRGTVEARQVMEDDREDEEEDEEEQDERQLRREQDAKYPVAGGSVLSSQPLFRLSIGEWRAFLQDWGLDGKAEKATQRVVFAHRDALLDLLERALLLLQPLNELYRHFSRTPEADNPALMDRLVSLRETLSAVKVTVMRNTMNLRESDAMQNMWQKARRSAEDYEAMRTRSIELAEQLHLVRHVDVVEGFLGRDSGSSSSSFYVPVRSTQRLDMAALRMQLLELDLAEHDNQNDEARHRRVEDVLQQIRDMADRELDSQHSLTPQQLAASRAVPRHVNEGQLLEADVELMSPRMLAMGDVTAELQLFDDPSKVSTHACGLPPHVRYGSLKLTRTHRRAGSTTSAVEVVWKKLDAPYRRDKRGNIVPWTGVSETERLRWQWKKMRKEAKFLWLANAHPSIVHLYGLCMKPMGLVFAYCNGGVLSHSKAFFTLDRWLWSPIRALSQAELEQAEDARRQQPAAEPRHISVSLQPAQPSFTLIPAAADKFVDHRWLIEVRGDTAGSRAVPCLETAQRYAACNAMVDAVDFLYRMNAYHRNIRADRVLVHEDAPGLLQFRLSDFSKATMPNFTPNATRDAGSGSERRQARWRCPLRDTLDSEEKELAPVDRDALLAARDVHCLALLIAAVLVGAPPYRAYSDSDDFARLHRLGEPPFEEAEMRAAVPDAGLLKLWQACAVKPEDYCLMEGNKPRLAVLATRLKVRTPMPTLKHFWHAIMTRYATGH